MKYVQQNTFLKKIYDAKHKVTNDPLPPQENLALYDANIRYVDDQIKRLFDNLEQMGLRDETLVIITSDHGEAFGEYGFFDHYSSYRNISQVPLIFSGSGVDNMRIPAQVQSIDLMPTLLELGGLEPPEGLDGKTMVSLLESKESHLRNEIVVNSDATVIQRMLVKDDYALVHTLARPVWNHIKEYEFFDLAKDPNQVNDISAKEKQKTIEMRITLANWLAQELDSRPDPLWQCVYRTGWMWPGLLNLLEPTQRDEVLSQYPELKKALNPFVTV